MRRIALLFLLFPFALPAQQDCQLFNVQDLAAENLALHDSIAQFSVDTVILQTDGSFEVQLGNGTTFTLILGCTDPAYIEYNSAANTDDGSCALLLGCTDPDYDEYNVAADINDGSCASLLGCTDPNYTEYNAEASSDDGSCATLVVQGCTDPAFIEYNASANTDDGSCFTPASTCIDVTMDGYTYSVVEIGDQCWFAENLRTTVYRNGDVIPTDLDGNTWFYTTSGASAVQGGVGGSCNHYYPPNVDPCDEAQSLVAYGRLYNWYAVDDSRHLCPSGWHVPSHSEWVDLENYILSQGFPQYEEGTELKASYGWCCGGSGTDSFGFSGLPGGMRGHTGNYEQGGLMGYFWSSTPSGGVSLPRAFSAYLYASQSDLAIGDSFRRANGMAVRCLQD